MPPQQILAAIRGVCARRMVRQALSKARHRLVSSMNEGVALALRTACGRTVLRWACAMRDYRAAEHGSRILTRQISLRSELAAAKDQIGDLERRIGTMTEHRHGLESELEQLTIELCSVQEVCATMQMALHIEREEAASVADAKTRHEAEAIRLQAELDASWRELVQLKSEPKSARVIQSAVRGHRARHSISRAQHRQRMAAARRIQSLVTSAEVRRGVEERAKERAEVEMLEREVARLQAQVQSQAGATLRGVAPPLSMLSSPIQVGAARAMQGVTVQQLAGADAEELRALRRALRAGGPRGGN